MKTKIMFFILVLLFVSFSFADYVIIVNKTNTNASISKGDLKKIFLGKKTSWDDGKKITVTVYKKNETQKKFLKAIVKKSEKQFAMFWKKVVFTGTGMPPKILKDFSETKAFIKANPTAIGYIDVGELDDTVKKLEIK